MQDYESRRSGEEIDAILDDVANKVDKVEGKGLSSEDFTSAEKRKLAGLENYNDADLRKDLSVMQNSVVEVRENLDEVTELVNDINTDIGDIYKTKQEVIADLDAIRRGAGKGDTSVQGVVVNNKQLTPDGKGNISLPKIPAEADIANMGFTKNKGTVTGVLVNGESKSPNSNGVVDLGEIKVDEVEFANDLTGVVEATPEMFTFRPSAGDKSVRDESAVIRRIKGNTSVWGQLAFASNYSSGGLQFEYNNDGTIELNGTVTSAVHIGKVDNINAHKYLSICEVLSMGNMDKFSFGNLNNYYERASFTGVGVKYLFANGPTSSTNYIGFTDFAVGTTISNVILRYQRFDLTAIFGAGNEPTTYNEFRKYYPDAYYPYCAPEVRSMRATGIETIGFNAFNGTYAEVIGGQAYYLGGAIEAAHFATERGGEMKPITMPESRVMTFSVSGYIYATGSDICINLSHSGVRNGEYKPYEKNTLLLPEIAKYFPDGMHSIGDVFDEINEEMAIQRCAVRAYEEGDENNAEVKTDKITTVYKLSEPIYTPIDEPLQLDYKVDDFGTERMLSDAPSAPFKADIVYQFNAEGRIRDNSRNIEKLEKLVKQTTENFATKDYVEQQLENVQKGIVGVESDTIDVLDPNKIYVYATSDPSSITINSFSTTDALTEEYVVQFRTFALAESITLPSGVMWANGVIPTLEGNTLYELSIVKTHIGETNYFKAVLTPFK